MNDMNQDRDLYAPELITLMREALQAMFPGEFSAHRESPYFVLKHHYGMRTDEGMPLYPRHLPEVMLRWAGMDSQTAWQPEDFLVLDLETTGLGRGGTVAFLIGLGYFENGGYVVEQIFLPDPDAEASSFDRLIELLEQKAVLITFNGKTFDIPVLQSRILYHRMWIDLKSKEHIDLLHLARRLWKRKLPSCALESIEYYVMEHIRDKELDIDGGLIPQTYYQYLITGDPEPLRRIFIHNQFDILHTAALFGIIGEAVTWPVQTATDPRIDYHAVAKLYLSQGYDEEGRRILFDLLGMDFVTPEIAYDLGCICKKEGDLEMAADCFGIGSALAHPPSLLEQCKLQEKRKDYPAAIESARQLLQRIMAMPVADTRKAADAEKRIARLSAKLAKAKPC